MIKHHVMLGDVVQLVRREVPDPLSKLWAVLSDKHRYFIFLSLTNLMCDHGFE